MNYRQLWSPRLILFVVVLFAMVLAALTPYFVPKSEALQIGTQVGHFRGLGLHDAPGYFGKNWFLIVADEGSEGYWEVKVNGFGYSPYRGYYHDGGLREEGLCMVSKNGRDIMADRHDVLRGRFYYPDGRVASEISGGTGTQILFLGNGSPCWELDLEDGKRVSHKMWYRNGQLCSTMLYREGVPHGPSIGYHENGQIRYRGTYSNGDVTGTFERYHEDGSVDTSFE